MDALPDEFQIGKTDLWIAVSHDRYPNRATGLEWSAPLAIFLAMLQNLHFMVVSQESLEKRIQKIKQQIGELGDLRPGALSQQYNVCGSPGCQCKASPPIKHGPYYQISFTRHGKSSSQFVRLQDLPDVRHQLENYRQLLELVDEWITLSAQLSTLRLREKRRLARDKETAKPRPPKRKPAGPS